MEAGGKLLVFGIYSGKVIFSQLPGEIALSAYVEFAQMKAGEHMMRFRIKADGTEAGFESEIVVGEDGPGAAPLPTIGLQIQNEGEIVISIQVDDGDWCEILRKQILVGQPPQI